MIVITGATGFIGSNLVADLNEAGRTDLALCDWLGEGEKWKNIAKRRFMDIISPDEAAAFLAGRPKIEAVFHLGANSSTTARDGDAILRTNLRASQMWWNYCADIGAPFIYASSAATYGDGGQGFADDDDLEALDQLRPLNLYGWSKHAFDKWAVEQAQRAKAPPFWAGLKFFNVYGPNEAHKDDMKSLVAKNFAPVREGQTLRLFKSHKEGYADGQQLRDFVYVKDCVDVMLWLWRNQPKSGLYNLGTGSARSFYDLMMATGEALGVRPHIEYVDMPESIRANYQYFTQADMRKLKDAGYTRPFYTLEAGVADYVRYLASPDPFR
jgi:ADP-L-glycero-D-manno-heptose 6-epimerase